MGKTFDDLPIAAALEGNEIFPVNQFADTCRASIEQIKTYIESGLTPAKVGLSNVENKSGTMILTDPSMSGTGSISGGLSVGNTSVGNPLVLDWYEESNWTPVDGINGTPIVMSVTNNRAVRIGNVVHFTASLAFATNTNTNRFTIAGLPWACSVNLRSYGNIVYRSVGTSGFLDTSASINIGSQLDAVIYSTGAGTLIAPQQNYTWQNLGNRPVMISGTYFVS